MMKLQLPLHPVKPRPQPIATPRFAEDEIAEKNFETPQHSINDVSIGADQCPDLLELPNTPLQAYKARRWETVSGNRMILDTLERESFRTTAPSQTQSSKFTMNESLRCHTNRVDNSQVESENHDGTIRIIKRHRKKNFYSLTPMPIKNSSIMDTKPQFDQILRALRREEI